MAVLRSHVPHSGRSHRLLSLVGGVALLAAAVGVYARVDIADRGVAVPVPTAAVPLYVLPEQPAALIAAAFVAVPERHAADWELNLMHAPHGR